MTHKVTCSHLHQQKIFLSEAPSILGSEIEEQLNVVQGGILSLECTAHGQPLPDMQWTHNGHVLSPDNVDGRYDLDSSSFTQTLAIEFNSATLSGKYACHATNNRGVASKVFKVHFQGWFCKIKALTWWLPTFIIIIYRHAFSNICSTSYN